MAVDAREARDRVELLARNRCHVPVSVKLAVPEMRNLRSSRPLPVRVEVPAGTDVVLVRLDAIERGRAWGYTTDARIAAGRPGARPDRHLYDWPFGGVSARLVQGPRGEISHAGIHAYDFGLPEGTPVLAARDGVVYRVVDGFGPGALQERFRKRSNRVVILHADGTLAAYQHLRAGIAVREGQRVAAGDRLGASGRSGYASGPHLHFHVQVFDRRGRARTLPVRFRGTDALTVGRRYGPGAPTRTSSSR